MNIIDAQLVTIPLNRVIQFSLHFDQYILKCSMLNKFNHARLYIEYTESEFVINTDKGKFR